MGAMSAKYLMYIIKLARHFAIQFYISPFSSHYHRVALRHCTDSFCADGITLKQKEDDRQEHTVLCQYGIWGLKDLSRSTAEQRK